MQRKKFIDLVHFIENNTHLLTQDDIFCLKAFFGGWFFRTNDIVEDEASLAFFQKWIEEKYNETHTVYDWATIISYYSNNKKKSFSIFFDLFEKFYYCYFINKEYLKNYPINGFEGTDDFLCLINLIKERTPMYIGKSSIFCLAAFINGWYFRNPKRVKNWDLLSDFEEWLFKRAKKNKESSSWYNLINYYYSSDENEALKNFFMRFEEYLVVKFKNLI